MEIRKLRPSISMFIFVACGIWLIALGLYFIFLRPSLLPEDLRYMGTSPGEIQSAMPGLERWVHHVFIVMGGFMTGAGVLTILVATKANAVREKWTWIAFALVGLFTVGTNGGRTLTVPRRTRTFIGLSKRPLAARTTFTGTTSNNRQLTPSEG